MPRELDLIRRLAVILVVWGTTSPAVLAADAPGGGVVRSHIQSVGEIAAAERDTPWAGLVTARAPAVLREHFRIERGAGLVVESVATGSLAERAGLRQHDILVSLDGQLLLIPEQFVALLDASGEDAALECRLIRAGKEQKLSLRGRPQVARSPGLRPAPSTLELLPRKAAVTGTVMQLADGAFQERDGDYVVRLTGGDEPRLTVRDSRGRIVFDGPIDTPERRSLVPPEVRERVAELERLVARQQQSSESGDDATRGKIRIGTLGIRPVEVR